MLAYISSLDWSAHMSSTAVAYAQENHPRFLNELKDLLRIPSISTAPEHAGDCRHAAEVLMNELKRIGMENARILETTGHPLVYADWLHAAGKPTVLMYGHYDVQPPDPFVALAQIIAKLKDENGHILIPGFYDDIVPPSKEELAAWKSLPFDEEEYREKVVGAKTLVGEEGYSVMERTWARPTVEVH